jgi:hypothetical protein
VLCVDRQLAARAAALRSPQTCTVDILVCMNFPCLRICVFRWLPVLPALLPQHPNLGALCRSTWNTFRAYLKSHIHLQSDITISITLAVSNSSAQGFCAPLARLCERDLALVSIDTISDLIIIVFDWLRPWASIDVRDTVSLHDIPLQHQLRRTV